RRIRLLITRPRSAHDELDWRKEVLACDRCVAVLFYQEQHRCDEGDQAEAWLRHQVRYQMIQVQRCHRTSRLRMRGDTGAPATVAQTWLILWRGIFPCRDYSR